MTLSSSFTSRFPPFSSRLSLSGALTGGVGTTFYCAPEQCVGNGKRRDYDAKADIFSFGVVVFEMFHPPFTTQMQRAETLLQLTNEVVSALILCSSVVPPPPFTKDDGSKDTRWDGEAWLPVGKWKSIAPVNCQRLILWCLGRSPSLRPSAVDILASELIPRRMELEKRYLEEALETLADPRSESRVEILDSLFKAKTPHRIMTTFDTDVALRLASRNDDSDENDNDDEDNEQNYINASSKNGNEKVIDGGRLGTKSEEKKVKKKKKKRLNGLNRLKKSLQDLGGPAGGRVSSCATMDSVSIHAATAALRRAEGCGRVALTGDVALGNYHSLREATRNTASALAMCAGTASAVTGSFDG